MIGLPEGCLKIKIEGYKGSVMLGSYTSRHKKKRKEK